MRRTLFIIAISLVILIKTMDAMATNPVECIDPISDYEVEKCFKK